MTELHSNQTVIYVEYYNPCCRCGKKPDNYKSQETLLKEKPLICTLFLVDSDKVDKCWGDDWDDAPSCCNSGTPYEHGDYPKITKLDIRLGDVMPQVTERRDSNE